MKYHRPNSDAYAALVMTFCDLDKSGDITFEEYLLACWSALSSDDRGLPQFAFHLFDTENDGQLTANTILKMMEKEQSARQQSPEELIQDLKAVMESGELPNATRLRNRSKTKRR